MKVLLRIVGLGLMAGCIAAVGLAFTALNPVGTESETPTRSKRPVGFAPLPLVDAQAGLRILERSPFVADRSGFSRETAMTPPQAPVEVRLTGVFRIGKQLHASLLIGGRVVVAKTGDEIGVGKIAKIENSAVEIEGAPPRRLEMFADR